MKYWMQFSTLILFENTLLNDIHENSRTISSYFYYYYSSTITESQTITYICSCFVHKAKMSESISQ